VRNKFASRPAAALQPPSAPPSAAAVAWCLQLGIDAAVLQQWGAGMAVVPHPESKQLVRHMGVAPDLLICLLLFFTSSRHGWSAAP
jgi:hypothetical protein